MAKIKQTSSICIINYNCEQSDEMFNLKNYQGLLFGWSDIVEGVFFRILTLFSICTLELVYPPSQLKAPLCSDVANVDFSICKKGISKMQKMHFYRL